MLGISNDSQTYLVALLIGGTVFGLLHADQVTFLGDARLSGVVRAMSPQGEIELTSELSPESLVLKSGTVKKVEFSIQPSNKAPASTLLELRNGDIFPVFIESMDDTRLNVVTADAGVLSISRASLKSMHLGSARREPIYLGPLGTKEWERASENAAGWTFSDDSLLANGPATSNKLFELPKRFVFKCKLSWQGSPSYMIYLADPLQQNTSLVDRYYIQFGSAGIEVKRESSKGKRFQTIIVGHKTPEDFPDHEMNLELRVDRKTSRVHLLIDGEPEGAGVDPNNQPPVGQGVTLVNQSPAGFDQQIREIQILELDNVRNRHLEENRGVATLDSLISREEDRWSGQFRRITKGSDGLVFSFKSDFQESPLELGEHDVATVFFAQPKNAVQEPAADPPFRLQLRGGGSIKVASCVFFQNIVAVKHALLGDLNISRDGVASVELLNPNSTPKVEKDIEE